MEYIQAIKSETLSFSSLVLCVIPSTSSNREGFTEEDFWLSLWRMFEISLGENGDMAFSGSEKYAVSLESSHVWKVKRGIETGSS